MRTTQARLTTIAALGLPGRPAAAAASGPSERSRMVASHVTGEPAMAEIDGATEPDLVLSVSPPVPRRSLATPDGYSRPACTPPPVPRPVTPPVP